MFNNLRTHSISSLNIRKMKHVQPQPAPPPQQQWPQQLINIRFTLLNLRCYQCLVWLAVVVAAAAFVVTDVVVVDAVAQPH